MKDGVYYSPKHGRIVEHNKYSVRIFWNKTMLDYLKANFSTTLNEELAEWLGVSQRTVIRKARELGLTKNSEWLMNIWEERRLLAWACSRTAGNPGAFKKGVRQNPEGEYKKGHKESEEIKAKRIASIKEWYRKNRRKASEKAKKTWETRRKNNK